MAVNKTSAVDREILRPLWKVHILHHASEAPLVGNWMLEELREHGYKVSPGTLYPMLSRLQRLGWLAAEESDRRRASKQPVRYRLTNSGRAALEEVRLRLRELQREVFSAAK
ncbi:MAG: PadR family transcriptional regulator [Verrucomicrobia bacterium RIFCSPLOWO2_12_FULL_64_8]|nr:MAG: PadR family transcriptional regulator [Verrucomicrobia bacterium RIFCSPLOWO2_12_FULL_64_8]